MATVKTAPAKPQKSTPATTSQFAQLTAQLAAARPKFKIPKKLAECADLLYTTRQERLSLARIVADAETDEKALKEYVVTNLPKSNASGISGTIANVSVGSKVIVMTEDFDKFMKYIVKEYPKNPGVVALLSRAINVTAAEEMWKAGKKIPGLARGTVPNISCTKV